MQSPSSGAPSALSTRRSMSLQLRSFPTIFGAGTFVLRSTGEGGAENKREIGLAPPPMGPRLCVFFFLFLSLSLSFRFFRSKTKINVWPADDKQVHVALFFFCSEIDSFYFCLPPSCRPGVFFCFLGFGASFFFCFWRRPRRSVD